MEGADVTSPEPDLQHEDAGVWKRPGAGCLRKDPATTGEAEREHSRCMDRCIRETEQEDLARCMRGEEAPDKDRAGIV